MNLFTHHHLYLLVFSTTVTVAAWAQAEPSSQTLTSDRLTYPTLQESEMVPSEPAGSELSERGRRIRGVYIPVAKLAHWKPKQLVQWVKNVGADAVIMDIKDDRGRVTFTKKLPLAPGAPHGIIPRMSKFLEALKEADIYAIGRLVCFKDNLFFKKFPEAAIKDRRTSGPWRDHSGSAWLDPYSLAAHQYIASIAKAAEELGFDEIQLDYVRFPVDVETKHARFTNKEGDLARYEAIALLLARVDFQIAKPLSIDVFGLTANRPGDSQRLGQSLEHLAPYIDAISPMLYLANWPKETWENATPKTPYEIVFNSVQRIRLRLGDNIAVRPLLQAFKYRALNFGVDFIMTQVNAAVTAGASGHLFWNQAGSYSKVATAWQRIPPLTPLISEESAAGAAEKAGNEISAATGEAPDDKTATSTAKADLP